MSTEKNSASDDAQIQQVYKWYVMMASIEGHTPLPFGEWVEKEMLEWANKRARDDARKVTSEMEPGDKAIYVAIRVEDSHNPVPGSVIRNCFQCQHEITVDPGMKEFMFRSESLICNRCVEEVVGKPYEEILREKFDE